MSHHINESEQSEAIRIKTGASSHDRDSRSEDLLKTHYSLSNISTDVSVLIPKTLLRLILYTRETNEPDSDTILSQPKNGSDGTLLIPARQVSLKLNYYNKVQN